MSISNLLTLSFRPIHLSLVLLLVGLAIVGASNDPYRAGDPIHDEEFKAAYEHVDGSVNEKVLNMLHHFKPVQSGALPEWAGVFIFTFILGCSLLTYMFASGCFSVRVSSRCFSHLESCMPLLLVADKCMTWVLNVATAQ